MSERFLEDELVGLSFTKLKWELLFLGTHFPVLGKVIGLPPNGGGGGDQERPAADLAGRSRKAGDRVGRGPSLISTLGRSCSEVWSSGPAWPPGRTQRASQQGGPLFLWLQDSGDQAGQERPLQALHHSIPIAVGCFVFLNRPFCPLVGSGTKVGPTGKCPVSSAGAKLMDVPVPQGQKWFLVP